MSTGIELPNTIGETADKLYHVRQTRLELDKQVKALKSQESELQDHGIALLYAERLTAGRGKVATFSISNVTVPVVDDWDLFTTYIADNNAFDLLQRRVNSKAWNDRLDIEHVSPPGTRPTAITKVSLTKTPKG